MNEFHDIILIKTRQHFILPILRFLSLYIPYIILIGAYHAIFGIHIALLFLLIIFGGIIIAAWYFFFWWKSYFIVTNEKIAIKVRNGIFSKFHISLQYKNIRDMAYSKNNIFHYLFDYGTFFARSSAGAIGDLEARAIPKIEEVYKIVNFLHDMYEGGRKNISSLQEIYSLNKVSLPQKKQEEESLEEIIESEKKVLLGIPGIKEVVVLDGSDRRYIFEHEEERNHGVFECLRRKVLFAATHDSLLRDPDEAIVMQSGEKVVFPVVDFHEIQRKKVSSSSPGLQVHQYLEPKFKDFDAYDATLLIGFDV